MSKYGIALATAGLSLIMAGEASATLTTFSFTGQVTYFKACENSGKFSCSQASAAIGSDVSGSITFDEALLPYDEIFPGVTQSTVPGIASYVFTSGAFTYTESNVILSAILANDRVNPNDAPDAIEMSAGHRLGFGIYATPPGHLFAGTSVSFLQPVDLQSAITEGRFGDGDGNQWNFSVTGGNFVAPVATVPEPGSLSLLLAALGLMGVAASRRKVKPA